MNKTSKRILAVGLPLTLVAVTGVGIAFWTSAGTGGGDAATNSAAAELVLAQVAAPTDMAPGVAPGAVSVSVNNPGPNSVNISQVEATIASVTPLAGETCTAADYVLGSATMTDAAGEVAPGATVTFTGATLGFDNDLARNQDGCKGATVTLSYAAS